jgi:dynein heavy chain 1
VLVSAGNLKRKMSQDSEEVEKSKQKGEIEYEQEVLIRSVCETVIPKLVAEDIPLLHSLLSDVFPGAKVAQIEIKGLLQQIYNICKERSLVDQPEWIEKLLQLYQIQQICHGVMMVGPSGSGKSAAWSVLLSAMEKFDGVEGEFLTSICD